MAIWLKTDIDVQGRNLNDDFSALNTLLVQAQSKPELTVEELNEISQMCGLLVDSAAHLRTRVVTIRDRLKPVETYVGSGPAVRWK